MTRAKIIFKQKKPAQLIPVYDGGQEQKYPARVFCMGRQVPPF